MSSLKKLLSVVELVTEERMSWMPEEIARELSLSLPTTYRYVRELCAVGLLIRLPGGGYTLGPQVITLDYQLRKTDPIDRLGRDLLRGLASLTGMSVLVCALLNERIITVYQTGGEDDGTLLYGRGRVLPLFRSATSQVILAHLKPAALRRLFERHAGEPDCRRLGESWGEFRKALAVIRRAGFCRSAGEIAPGRVGISVPISGAAGLFPASLSVTASTTYFSLFNEETLRQRLRATADTLGARLADESAAQPNEPLLPTARAEAPLAAGNPG